MNKGKVFVGLSGGVDSAVSAALLKQAGYDVTGVFIKVWQPFDKAQGKPLTPCTWRQERRDAMRVALTLNIPFLFFDLSEEYKKGVVDYMIREYSEGRTPNPDVFCNREVKFGAFWKKAKEMGADYIATGHYARVAKEISARKITEVFSDENLPDSPAVAVRDDFIEQNFPASLQTLSVRQAGTNYQLQTGRDSAKDQSYFLWTLTQDDLAHTLFPIGHLKKEEVRKLAKNLNLPVADKKDSQGICFIGDLDMEKFLREFIETRYGDVLSTGGEIIGRHKGSVLYTIGERHGFEITRKTPSDKPYFVVSKDLKANTITVSQDEREAEELSPKKIILRNINFIRKPDARDNLEAEIRYRGERYAVEEPELLMERNILILNKPARGLSLGQSAVFYRGEECLGGGILDAIMST